MEFSISPINWLGVFIATIAYSAFAGVWHRQFAFGDKWHQAMDFKRPKNWKETNIYFIVPFISCLLATVGIAVLSELVKVSSIGQAITLGLITGICFAATVTFTNAVIPIMKKPLVFGAITGAAHVIGFTLVSAIIHAFGN